MSKYILSTMTSPIAYTFYQQTGDLPVERHKVLIAGGRGIPSHRSGFGEQSSGENGIPMWTAEGMVTPVSDSDLEQLESHHVFKKHLEQGLVRVLGTDIRGNHKAVMKEAKTMEEDGFGQLNNSKLKQKIKVTTEFMKQEDEFRL
jgi:hypothetical protein